MTGRKGRNSWECLQEMGGNRCFLPEASTHLNFWIPPYVWCPVGKVLISGNLSLLPCELGLQSCHQEGCEQAPGPQ